MIEFLMGVGIVWGSQIVWSIRQRAKRPKPPEPVKAICGCKHHYAMHDPKTGECHAQIEYGLSKSDPIKDSWGDKIIGYKEQTVEVKQCGCRRYTGPEPLPSYYAPELSS